MKGYLRLGVKEDVFNRWTLHVSASCKTCCGWLISSKFYLKTHVGGSFLSFHAVTQLNRGSISKFCASSNEYRAADLNYIRSNQALSNCVSQLVPWRILQVRTCYQQNYAAKCVRFFEPLFLKCTYART